MVTPCLLSHTGILKVSATLPARPAPFLDRHYRRACVEPASVAGPPIKAAFCQSASGSSITRSDLLFVSRSYRQGLPARPRTIRHPAGPAYPSRVFRRRVRVTRQGFPRRDPSRGDALPPALRGAAPVATPRRNGGSSRGSARSAIARRSAPAPAVVHRRTPEPSVPVLISLASRSVAAFPEVAIRSASRVNLPVSAEPRLPRPASRVDEFTLGFLLSHVGSEVSEPCLTLLGFRVNSPPCLLSVHSRCGPHGRWTAQGGPSVRVLQAMSLPP